MKIPLTASETHQFTPPALANNPKRRVTITLRVPTTLDRDTLASNLMRIGVRRVEIPMIRAMIVDQFYEVYGEEKGEELTALADTVWQLGDAFEHEMEQWVEQDRQRQFDIAAGAPHRDPLPKPKSEVTRRMETRLTLAVDELQDKSQKMRNLMADFVDYGMKHGEALVRLHVASVAGALSLQWPAGEVMPPEALQTLREHLGLDAWRELITECNRLYVLDGEEEKNSASPPVNLSDRTGLPSTDGALASNAGTSTESSTGPVPDVKSAMITELSSGSTTEPAAKPSSSSPTVGG